MKIKYIIKFLPAVIWMMIIYYFSSIPTTSVVGTDTQRFIILKSFHLIEYAVLGILLYFAYKKYRYTIISAYLYAISDELHQSFTPGRNCRFTDTLFDLVGILIGLFFINRLLNYFKNKYK
jgi:VanZ family protein